MRAVFYTINLSQRVGTIGKLVQSETSYNHSWRWNCNIQECVPPAQWHSCRNFLSAGKLCDCACHVWQTWASMPWITVTHTGTHINHTEVYGKHVCCALVTTSLPSWTATNWTWRPRKLEGMLEIALGQILLAPFAHRWNWCTLEPAV